MLNRSYQETWAESRSIHLYDDATDLTCDAMFRFERDDYGATCELDFAILGKTGQISLPRQQVVDAFGSQQVEAWEARFREEADAAFPPARDWRNEERAAYRAAV